MGKHWTPGEMESVAQVTADAVQHGKPFASAFRDAQRELIPAARWHRNITPKLRERIEKLRTAPPKPVQPLPAPLPPLPPMPQPAPGPIAVLMLRLVALEETVEQLKSVLASRLALPPTPRPASLPVTPPPRNGNTDPRLPRVVIAGMRGDQFPLAQRALDDIAQVEKWKGGKTAQSADVVAIFAGFMGHAQIAKAREAGERVLMCRRGMSRAVQDIRDTLRGIGL